jgi:hypothetical protein
MKNFISIGLLCVSICFYSCKKDKQTEPETQTQTTTTPIPNYSALKVGNYWIYERFETDQFGISTSLNIIDSCYIEKDTTINGQQYFKYVQPQIVSYNPTISSTANSFRYIYDSLSYIIPYPRYNFSSYSYLDTSHIIAYDVIFSGTDTLYTVQIKMTDKDVMFNTPAGNFKTINQKATFTFANNYLSCNQTRRFMNTRRAENIGIVFYDFDFIHSLCKHWDRRLIRYHVVL